MDRPPHQALSTFCEAQQMGLRPLFSPHLVSTQQYTSHYAIPNNKHLPSGPARKAVDRDQVLPLPHWKSNNENSIYLPMDRHRTFFRSMSLNGATFESNDRLNALKRERPSKDLTENTYVEMNPQHECFARRPHRSVETLNNDSTSDIELSKPSLKPPPTPPPMPPALSVNDIRLPDDCGDYSWLPPPIPYTSQDDVSGVGHKRNTDNPNKSCGGKIEALGDGDAVSTIKGDNNQNAVVSKKYQLKEEAASVTSIISTGTVADRVNMFDVHKSFQRSDDNILHSVSLHPQRLEQPNQHNVQSGCSQHRIDRPARSYSHQAINASTSKVNKQLPPGQLIAQCSSAIQHEETYGGKRTFATINRTLPLQHIYKSAVDNAEEDNIDKKVVEVGTAFLHYPHSGSLRVVEKTKTNNKQEMYTRTYSSHIRTVKENNHVTCIPVGQHDAVERDNFQRLSSGPLTNGCVPTVDLKNEDKILEVMSNKITVLMDSIDRQNKRIDSLRRAFDREHKKDTIPTITSTSTIPSDSTYQRMDILSEDYYSKKRGSHEKSIVGRPVNSSTLTTKAGGSAENKWKWKLMSCVH